MPNAIRAGVESYSIKRLELFFGCIREEQLQDANRALARVQAALKLDDASSLTEEDKQAVTRYNADDCAATEKLRDWLEERRSVVVAGGIVVERPGASASQPSERVTDREERARALAERLTPGKSSCCRHAGHRDVFYDGKLHPVASCADQKIRSTGPVRGTGLRPEAEAIVRLVANAKPHEAVSPAWPRSPLSNPCGP